MIAAYPLTILADDREKAAYTFTDLSEVYVVRKRLETGDYSLPFAEGRVAVSRKTLPDLYDTLFDTARRERFETELARMSHMESACVVVEGNPLVDLPPGRTAMHQQAINTRIDCFRLWYPKVAWMTISGRRGGEILTYAFLLAFRERAARQSQEQDKEQTDVTG